ncbi:UDP-N-acetylglucosamine 2-epimerase (hydrolyzing) [Christiangramia fulva]|uniref:UDP-N-acetylglucosamine 2-epimerase (Hydrolyzing) n=1 Tax=Christiangramia fulva TaxID=2126553 RepID=A0A2R3Z0P9_9FLAO|nr:UDP-N-acetylglucosamine 2-epimerase [Christiangramia fulva]AVR43826.1 UDP-N-acetylglucosamine 2-epimerase (hydrolyzing) [Christiangramia fulva]
MSLDRRKICVVITARPSYSRIKSALQAIKEHPKLELQLVVAGSALLDRYGNAADFIRNDGFEAVAKVYMVLEGENPTTMAKTTGLGLMELTNVFYNLQPDAVITIADRFETIATSIAAAYQNIPLVHIQGGEVTGSIDEKVRHANTKLADIHLVSNEDARERVIRLGEDPEMVINTGCPSIDLAKEIANDEALNFNPLEKYGGVGKNIRWQDGYLVVMQHPVTSEYEKARTHILETLHAVSDSGIPSFWFWPNVDAGSDGTSNGIRTFREQENPENIHFFKNIDPLDFLRLLKHSKMLIGNSSVGIRECSYLGVPAIDIGSRQQRRLKGENVTHTGYKREEILAKIKELNGNGRFSTSTIYGNGNSGKKIANILAKIELRSHKSIQY